MARKRNRQLLQQYRYCAYCAGENSATEIDHMPNIGMFPKRLRPPGLEIPSCSFCNRGSKLFEDVASFLGSFKLQDASDTDTHFEKKLAALSNNQPNILEELLPTFAQKKHSKQLSTANELELAGFDVRGPNVRHSMLSYGAKLGLALHWNARKSPLPKDGKIIVLWYTNANSLKNEIPQQLFEMLGAGKTLAQGKLNAKSVFQYSSGISSDTLSTIHWATFGQAFMYYLFVGQEFDEAIVGRENCYKPGFIKQQAYFQVAGE